MTQAQHDLIDEETDEYHLGSRTKSAALLAWFLQHVWRLDPEEIDDAICDGKGDKGIDGLVVDDELSEITLFQAKYRESADRTQGDKDLRDLMGSSRFFESVDAVDGLLASNPNAELQLLLARNQVRQKVADGMHVTRLVFVTNATLDDSGKGYLDAVANDPPPLEVWDRPRIAAVAERTRRPDLLDASIHFTAVTPPIVADLTPEERMAIGLIPADQLIKLPGIEDRTLFSRNVRLSLGRTRINRDLSDTIVTPAEHDLFPAYHNGLTLLTKDLDVAGESIALDGVSVVNGCQSLVALFNKRTSLTPKLRLLVKIVRLPPDSDVADDITYRTNNQNAVDIRDQRSTEPIMRDLQAQVRDVFGDDFGFAIRAGETLGTTRTLDNQFAAQLIKAVYLGEPWQAVRKVRLFDEDFRAIFNRTIDAYKLLFLDLLGEVIWEARVNLRDDLRASFASVRFALAFLVARVLELSEAGALLLKEPQRWLPSKLDEVKESLRAIADDVVDSVNFHIGESENEDAGYDPKVAFKSKVGVDHLEHDVLSHSRRQAKREEDYLFTVSPT
jgi:AIPR protein